MKPIFNTLIGLLLLLSATVLNAQVLNISFSPAAPGGTVGSVITVDVVAQKFEGIAGAQFPILYDATKLQFKTVKSLTPDLGTSFIYNEVNQATGLCPGGSAPPCATSIANSAPGKVAMVWFDPSGTGNYLTDNTVLFKIEFTVLAAGTSNIYIGAAPPPAINVFGENGVPATFIHPTGTPVVTGFGLIIPNDSIPPGGTVCFPVTVNGFNSIVGMQFAVNWNSNIFTYSHVQNYNVSGFTCNSFAAATGRLSVQWEDATAAGITLTNGTSLFDVCLVANGPNATSGTTTTVAANGIGLPPASPISIENTTGANLWTANSSYPGTMLISNSAVPDDEVVRFIADTVNVAAVGNPASANIKVKNFKNLNEFQFVLSYDASVLGAPTFTVASAVPDVNNQFRAEAIPGQTGKIQVSWRAQSAPNGLTLVNGATICTFTFPTTSAAPGSMSPLSIGSLTSVTPAINLQVQEKPNTFVMNGRTPNCPHPAANTDGWVKLSSVSAVPTVTFSTKTDVNCFGVNTGSIDISVTGGLNPQYTYLWSGPGITAANQNVQDPSGLSAGSYQVTVTSGTVTTSLSTPVVVAGPTTAISVPTSGVGALAIQNVKCFGGTNGSISLSATGGTAPYTYLWTGGVTGNSRTNLAAGSYTVTITDNKGCTFVPSAYTITAPTVPMAVSASNIKNVRCMNDANGSATASVTGNQGAVTYTWTNNITGGSPSNLVPGTYTVTATDANGCTAVLSSPITITNPPSQLTVTTPTTTSPACPGQNTGSITVSAAGGWSGYAVQWSPLPGTGGMTAMNVAPGTYTATVTDANGCALVRSAVVAAPQANTVTNSTPVNVTCHNQANGSISITLSSTFNSINWVDGTGAAAGSGTSINGLGGGDYTATVNYGSGCTLQHGPVTVLNPTAITIPAPAITEDDDVVGGAIDLTATGGTGLLSYSWAGPAGFTATSQDISGLDAGTYTVTVKDANNCSSVQSIVVPSACAVCGASAVVTQDACENDGCITVTVPANAPSPFIATVDGSTQPVVFPQGVYELELCGLAAGVHAVEITDANNQSYSLTAPAIIQRPQVTAGYQFDHPLQGNANGSIQVNSAPGLTYQWISGNVPQGLLYSPVLFNLDSGVYEVVVTNNAVNGCSKTYTIHLIRQYAVLAPCGTPAITQPPCASSTNGSIELFPQGGDNVYSYTWSTGATSKKLSNLAPGTYTCTVSSGDGQSAVCGPYTLSNISSLAISNVNELSDYNGYQVSGTGICNGSASVVTTGASGAVSYLWSNGVTSANNTTLCGGAYSVVVTDQTGCTSSWAGDLTSPTAVNAVYSPATSYNGYGVSCNGKCDGAARVNITGGVLPYLVKWSGGKTELITNSIVFAFDNNLCAGEQSVEVTDANGVVTNYSFVLTEPDPLEITFTDVPPTSVADCDGEIIPFAEGAVGDVTFSWRSQFHVGNGLRADGLCAEEELLFTVTDENGCKTTATHVVPFPEDGCFLIVPIVTPNGDGDNDYFKITCIERVPNTVEIYDRWNQSAGKYTNYANSWDGTRNGVPVPEGVYFVVVNLTDFQGRPMTLKGYVNVLH